MDKIIKIFIAVFAVIAVAAAAYVLVSSQGNALAASSPAATAFDDTTVYFFYGAECPHCQNVEPFIDNLTKEYPDVDIHRLEVWHNETNQKIYSAVNAAAGVSSEPGVPEVVIGRIVLVGEKDIPDKLEAYVQALEKKKVNTAQ